jgi:hypothetical protein
MPEFMYRFRSIESLLGTSDRVGELEGQYIFFAASETLNDPLEGYRESYWSGDEILWENFLKHYVTTLTFRFLQYMTGGGYTEFFPISVRQSSQDPALLEFLGEIVDGFLSDETIKEHVRVLALKERHVKRPELQCHFQMIHKLAYHTVQSVIYKQTQEPALKPSDFDWQKNKSYCDEFLSAIEKNLELYQFQNNHVVEQGNQLLLSKLSEINFNAQYHQWTLNGGDPWFDLTMSFPEAYCKSLVKLNFPDWYVACFMSECTDSSIWGTYGNNHSAACLKFKTNGWPGKRTLSLRMPTGEGREGVTFSEISTLFHKVSYEEDFIEIDFFASLGMVPALELTSEWFSNRTGELSSRYKVIYDDIDKWRGSYHENYQKSLVVKLGDWERENEYRLTMSSYAINIKDPKNRCIKYDFNSLEGIIFGINTSPQDKMKIVAVVEKLCEKYCRGDFSFYQARYDNFQKKIIVDPIRIRKMKVSV